MLRRSAFDKSLAEAIPTYVGTDRASAKQADAAPEEHKRIDNFHQWKGSLEYRSPLLMLMKICGASQFVGYRRMKKLALQPGSERDDGANAPATQDTHPQLRYERRLPPQHPHLPYIRMCTYPPPEADLGFCPHVNLARPPDSICLCSIPAREPTASDSLVSNTRPRLVHQFLWRCMVIVGWIV